MPLKRVVATITVLIGLLLAATLWSVGCDAEPAASTAAEPTTQVAPSELRDALTGPFPSDLSDPEAVVHSRTVVEREGQPDVTFDFWWQEATGCYRVERRFGSSSVLSEAQVFDGARLAGFVATGHDRHAFDMSYEQSQELNEVMDPWLVAGTEAQRLEAVSGLIERGAIAESGSEAREGRPVVRYRGTVEGTVEGTAGSGGQGSSSAEAVHELLIDEATRLVVEEQLQADDLYSVGSGYIYLARRADAVVALISNLSQKDILAAGAALRPFSSVTSRRSSPWAQAAPRR